MTTPDARPYYDPGARLCYADIALGDARKPSFMWVRIKQSKTDPIHRGIDLFVGQKGADLCPVAALLDYLRCWGPSLQVFLRPVSHKVCRDSQRGAAAN